VEQEFDFIAGFDSGFGCKPGPDPLLAFAEAMGLDPADVLMVGDSLHDLHAARAAGMRAVAVLTGVAGKEVLAPHAEAVLPHIGHLPAWLARG
jgi:phosphoglycolate phosphatase